MTDNRPVSVDRQFTVETLTNAFTKQKATLIERNNDLVESIKNFQVEEDASDSIHKAAAMAIEAIIRNTPLPLVVMINDISAGRIIIGAGFVGVLALLVNGDITLRKEDVMDDSVISSYAGVKFSDWSEDIQNLVLNEGIHTRVYHEEMTDDEAYNNIVLPYKALVEALYD